MSWTKGDIVQEALAELGIADYDFDIIPEQLERDIRRLDTMMGVWAVEGIGLNYPLASGPDSSNKDDEIDIPDYAIDAVLLGLAVRLAPSYGKTVSMDTKASYKAAYNALLQRFAPGPQVQLEQLPRGAGAKSHDYPFFTEAPDKQLEPIDESVVL